MSIEKITVDFGKICGKIKPMHAVNNGPLKKKNDQSRDNYDSYKALCIPYARNHDAAFCPAYGGEHSNDITGIFPDFDADPYDPASYDFTLTDEYMERILSAGTKPFFRLGQKIEHEIKKYGTLPPKDFHKWAIVCEHIIKHMNYGWSDGHNYGIDYWEIWNEPDLDRHSDNKRTWGGNEQQFFEFYKIAASHLKECFPELKIGGPALAHDIEWADEFLEFCAREKLPLDFFSWHIYSKNSDAFIERDKAVKDLLVKHGYQNTESILDEWNYIIDWKENYVQSVVCISNHIGAAFCAEVMLREQKGSADMLMYYDARPSVFNGLWNFYTQRPQKAYHVFRFFGELYDLGSEVLSESGRNIPCVAATDGKRGAIMLSDFDSGDSKTEDTVEISVKGMKFSHAKIYTVSEECDGEEKETDNPDNMTLKIRKNSVLLIKLEK